VVQLIEVGPDDKEASAPFKLGPPQAQLDFKMFARSDPPAAAAAAPPAASADVTID